MSFPMSVDIHGKKHFFSGCNENRAEVRNQSRINSTLAIFQVKECNRLKTIEAHRYIDQSCFKSMT